MAERIGIFTERRDFAERKMEEFITEENKCVYSKKTEIYLHIRLADGTEIVADLIPNKDLIRPRFDKVYIDVTTCYSFSIMDIIAPLVCDRNSIVLCN